jgi:hypothetical protein
VKVHTGPWDFLDPNIHETRRFTELADADIIIEVDWTLSQLIPEFPEGGSEPMLTRKRYNGQLLDHWP